MSDKLRNTLAKLTQQNLIDVICALHDSGREEAALVNQYVAAFDPKQLYKLINKQLTSIKASSRFIDYRESYGLADKLNRINQNIDQYLAQQAPDLAIKLCQRLISLDNKIFERADDSGGAIGSAFCFTYEILDRAFINSNLSNEQIADYLFEIYTNDEYGCRGYIIDYCKQSLKKGAHEPLEKKVNDSNLEPYQKNHILKAIADARQDVDYFIRLAESKASHFGHGISDADICEVAKRLNAAFRSEEAIEWLNKISDESHHAINRTKLLIEAYQLEGDTKKVKAILWASFEKYLKAEDYLHYLKIASDQEKALAKEKAVELAKNCQHHDWGLRFLYDIQELERINDIILSQPDKLDGTDYSLYRNLSKDLAKHEYYLAATLLRRELIINVLHTARSKYYKYAVSDLKKANEFANEVTDWQEHPDQQQFLETLHQEHFRKKAFWSLVEGIIY